MSEPRVNNPTTSVLTSKLSDLCLYSHSPWPVWSLSALFIGTTPFGVANRAIPPLTLRFTFGLIFGGAGYILSTGDYENGCGITTSWTGSYFLVNGIRKEFKKLRTMPPPSASPPTRPPLTQIWLNITRPFRPTYWSERGQQVTLNSLFKNFRNRVPPPLVLTLNTATAATMFVYGMEYFVFWGTRKKEAGRG